MLFGTVTTLMKEKSSGPEKTIDKAGRGPGAGERRTPRASPTRGSSPLRGSGRGRAATSAASSSTAASGSSSQGQFVCPFCGKQFGRRYNKEIHIRIHTGDAPYVCGIDGCEQRYKWRSTLFNHRKYHGVGRGSSSRTIQRSTGSAIRDLLQPEEETTEPSRPGESFYTEIQISGQLPPSDLAGLMRCPVSECQRVFNHRQHLLEHMREHGLTGQEVEPQAEEKDKESR